MPWGVIKAELVMMKKIRLVDVETSLEEAGICISS